MVQATAAIVNLDRFAAAVEGIVGAAHMHAGERTAAYAFGDVAPMLVAAPGSAAEVAALVRAADDAGAAIVPWGGGTQQHLGAPPRRYDLAVRLTRLNRVLAYSPDDLAISVEAGVTLADLRGVLAAEGQIFPVEAPLPERVTVGGMHATHISGPRRLGYGTMRDFVIGLEVAYPDGTLGSAGGMVVKNVTGYDMMKLHLGALGTLGVITRLNFKTLPRPAAERTFVVQFSSPLPSFALAADLLNSPLMPTALEQFSPGAATAVRAPLDGYLLCVRGEGSEQTIVRQERDLREMAMHHGATEVATLAGDDHARFWSSAADWNATAELTPHMAVLKLSTLLTDLPAAILDVMTVGEQHGLQITARASAGNGVAFLRVAGDAAGVGLRATLDDLHHRWPALIVYGATPVQARALPMWGIEPQAIGVMRSLKANFDPHSTLNPGRYVGGI